MKKQHLLFITQYFYPENFKGNDIAFDLVQRGVDVTVITGIPNYPSGKFYKGYGLFKKTRETINGVHIIRIPLVPRGSNSIMLMLNYFSFAFFASIFTFFHCLLHKYDSCFIQQLSPIT
ncbi:MAG: glycosyltransferase WbuB, partial [Alistipes sp.]